MARAHLLVAVLALLVTACGGGSTSPLPPPTAPKGLSLAVGAEQLSVEWRPVATATGYDVLLSPVAGRTRAELLADDEVRTAVVRGTSICAFDRLPAGSTWYVRVDAFGPGGTSPLSAESSATLPPAAPATLTLEAGLERIGIAWSEVEGATTYDVYLAQDAALTSETWEACEGGCAFVDAEAPLEVTGLDGDRPCFVVVVARNEGGSSPDSARVSTTPLAPPPEAVGDLEAESAAGEIVLTWSALPGATYVLYLALDPSISKQNWQDLEGGERHVGVTSPYVLEGVEPGTTIYFVVTLLAGAQESPESLVVSATADARGTFRRGDLVTVGAAPADVAVADLDDDGALDFVTVNRGDGTLSVGQGSGDGSFEVVTETTVGEAPCVVVTGDVDRDGLEDVVILLAGEGAILVLEGDGAFGFEELVRIEAGIGTGALRLVDVDDDDNLDIVATDAAEDLVRIWLGDGEGGFTETDAIETAHEPVGLTAAELDGDGVLDLVVTHAMDSSVLVLAGDGTGAFETMAYDPTIPLPIATLAVDWDDEGPPELWIVGGGAACAELRTLGEEGTYVGVTMFDLLVEPSAAAAGDFDGDGAVELVFLGQSSATLQVLDRTLSGEIARRQLVEELVCGAGTIAVHDLDGDGILDLLFCAEEDDGVQVMLGND